RAVRGIPLLLVVDRSASHLHAHGIGSGDGDGAALTIGRNSDLATHGSLAALLDGKRQSTGFDLLIRPHVGRRITSDGVVFAVEFAGPFVMDRLTGAVNTIDGHFYAVARSRISD